MGETLLANAMRELKVARDEIAGAHRALDELGAPGQWQMMLPERIRAMAENAKRHMDRHFPPAQPHDVALYGPEKTGL